MYTGGWCLGGHLRFLLAEDMHTLSLLDCKPSKGRDHIFVLFASFASALSLEKALTSHFLMVSYPHPSPLGSLCTVSSLELLLS